MKKILYLLQVLLFSQLLNAQQSNTWGGKFEQMSNLLPTPNEYRTASGSPGPRYWQQKADYVISVELNDDNQTIIGTETITYTNNAPETMNFIWLQLDQNRLAKESITNKASSGKVEDSVATRKLAANLSLFNFDGGFNIKSIKSADGKNLPHVVNYTMMRVDLPSPLLSGKQISLTIEWSFNINDRMKVSHRSGYEYFPEDGNYAYHIGQFFPRMCVFDDLEGWQNKQYMGTGEFALPFGDYKVKITVPADHILAATGVLQNPDQVLTKTEIQRFQTAKSSFDKPVVIVTQDEVIQKEKTKSKQKKTWEFHASNVRDFAFATSRKFIWDAMAVKVGDKTPLAMSYYPKEGNPLWEKESSLAVRHTLLTYSKYTIDYPYPVAISVHAPDIGMEYPMICFNYGRPKKDGTFTQAVKEGMVNVIIHEVGHNFFPMIINNDERQCAWMDEGINSFLQYLTTTENYPDFKPNRGPAANLVPYMKGDKAMHRPLMTNPEQIYFVGSEQYGKAATSLNILRETVMGRELFDMAFKEFAKTWAFKHPKPSDFFRVMENASAVDLDWFWKGWYFTTDVVDQSVDQVKWYKVKKETPQLENKVKQTQSGDISASQQESGDFSKGPQEFTLLNTPDPLYGEFRNKIDDKSIRASLENQYLYEITLSNKGGLVMPVIIEFSYKDGTKEIERLPAEIWRFNEQKVTKIFVKNKEVTNIILDPLKETTDINMDDNVFPKIAQPSKFDEIKKKSN